jgi:alkylation response protein AidB-like acyl-CoA dehydrogenase
VLEALGRGGADRGLLFALGAHLFGCHLPLRLHAAVHQRDLAEGLAGGGLIGALAVTEPQGGSSPGQMQTRADPVDGGYRLTGHKTLITNAPDADLFLILAATRPERGSFGWTAFVVGRGTPGLSVAPLAASGLAGAPMGDVRLDGCLVEASQVLGTPDGGLRIFTTAMQWERTGILAGFIGAAERDLAACVDYVNRRRDAEGPLAAHQAVAHRIARSKLRLERARLLLLRAAWAVEGGHKSAQQAVALAKYEAAESLVETALDLMRIGAGAGWLDRLGTATALRDTLGTLFASGTGEIQLNIVAASMGLKRR